MCATPVSDVFVLCVNAANSVWAYGNLGINPGEDVLQEYAAFATHKINEFTPQNLSNFVWALAKLGVYNDELFSTACWKAVQTMHAFTPQSVANFIWAFATLGHPPDAAFLRAAVAHSTSKLDQWAPQNLSNVAWAFGTLKDESLIKTYLPTFLPAIVAEVTSRLSTPEKEKDFSRQHLANYFWALAVTEYNPGAVALRALLDSLQKRVSFCIPQELSNVVWSAAKLQFYDGHFMDAFADEAVSRIEEFTQQNLGKDVLFTGGLVTL